MINSIYYDISRTLSYNALINFVLGARGKGKTYGFKKWAISDFLKTGRQFGYIRRYTQEFDEIHTFFNDIADEFPDCKFKVEGTKKAKFYINDKLAGYGFILSTAKIKKSNPYPNINKLCFDEFIIEKGVYRYLPNEPIHLLELYETIARMRDDVRLMCLSNAITFTNPYFLYFKLSSPVNKKGIKVTNDGLILLEYIIDNGFSDAKNETRFGKLIKGTTYGKYNVENKFLLDDKTFVRKPFEKSNYMFTIKAKGLYYGVYLAYDDGKIFVSSKYDPSFKAIYTTILDNHEPNIMLLKGRKDGLFKSFTDYYKLGLVYFDSVQTKNIIIETLQYTI